MNGRPFVVLLYPLCFGVVGYALYTYGTLPLGAAVGPELKAAFTAHPIGIYLHIVGGSVALLLGPLQFSRRLRSARPSLHRWLGRVYLGCGILVGGLAGLYSALHAFGGPVGRLGFGTLAVVWLYTGARAYAAARGRDFVDHRKWMVRNFSLTFAAVTLRIYLPLSQVLGIEFPVAYPAIAWLAWVPNLVVAEWLFNRQRGNRAAPASSGSRSALVK